MATSLLAHSAFLLAHSTFLLAQSTSDNAGGGALLSLWFPLGLFIIVAAVLWVIYTRPHGRVPPRPPARAHGASSVAGGAVGDSTAQQPVTPPEHGPGDAGRRQ